jgi:biopolymer transport protein ExbD
MAQIERTARSTRAIPLTPLIDVVFLLMVFFILTTNFSEVEALKLATVREEAQAAKQIDKSQQVQQLVLLGSGAAFLNNQLVYFGDLEQQLEVLYTKMPGASMTLQSDDKVQVQMLVDVLDMVYLAGGRDVKVSRWKESETIKAE